jgi:MFS transporter, SHS family, lactate transporter
MTNADALTRPTAWWREPTRDQWMAFFAAWSGWVLDAFDFTIFLLVMPAIKQEFGVSMTAAAGSVTLTLLLRLLGGVAAGAAADRWGRKLPLMISVIWFALCDGAVALAPSFGWVLVLRTLFGFGMGAEWTAGATLAMENWPERSRGIASGILQGSWAIGYLLAGVASQVVVPAWGWRGLFVLAAIPALLVLPIRAWVPESPGWQKGKPREPAAPFRELLTASTLRSLLWASLVMAVGFGAYYGLISLYPTMLQTQFGRSSSPLVEIFNVGMLCGAVACGWLASRKGVVPAVVVPALVMLPLLPLYVGVWPELLGLGAFLGGVFGAGFCGVTPLLLTNMFPARIRARSVGLVYHLGAFAAAFVPTGVAALAEYAGLTLSQSIGVVSGGCLLGMAGAILLLPRAAPAEASAGAPAAAAAQVH